MGIAGSGEFVCDNRVPESVVTMNAVTIDMLKRKGVTALAFFALGVLACAESDQLRQAAIQLSGLFGGVGVVLTAVSVWLSKQRDNEEEARRIVAKYQEPPKEVAPEDAKVLAKVGIEVVPK